VAFGPRERAGLPHCCGTMSSWKPHLLSLKFSGPFLRLCAAQFMQDTLPNTRGKPGGGERPARRLWNASVMWNNEILTTASATTKDKAKQAVAAKALKVRVEVGCVSSNVCVWCACVCLCVCVRGAALSPGQNSRWVGKHVTSELRAAWVGESKGACAGGLGRCGWGRVCGVCG